MNSVRKILKKKKKTLLLENALHLYYYSMMLHLFFLVFLTIPSTRGEQSYDADVCTTSSDLPGSRYICSSFQDKCDTFLVYRANEEFQTIANISILFNKKPEELLTSYNNITSAFQILETGREVLVPIKCSCSGEYYYEAGFSYIFPGRMMTIKNVSCNVYEGLVKSITLINVNPSAANTTSYNIPVGSILHVPLKCACPDNKNISSSNMGVKYLITYPFLEDDDTYKVAKKFSIPVTDIWEANHMDTNPTVYPTTTILVPVIAEPVINFQIPNTDPPTPSFLPTVPIETSNKHLVLVKVYITVSVVGAILVVVTLLACVLYLKALKKFNSNQNTYSFARRISITSFSTPRSSQVSGPTPKTSTTNSCLSPDLLDNIKYSLCSYSMEELKKATNSFSEETKIGDDVYMGLVDAGEILIKQARFEETRQVIDLHAKMNHVNIVKLDGVCYCDNGGDFSWSYLVFEFPVNGCLRDCLSSSSASLRWHKRTQIAFDIATGLHYLHYCMVPPCTHLSITSKTIFLTRSWRAKLAVFGNIPTIGIGTSRDNLVTTDHFLHGSVSEKEDIFAFGVVLLELMSGKKNEEWKTLRESITFLGGECFDQLRNFMDPSLKEDYPLAEALCLAVLAKACVEEEAPHRPSMDDILKVLARMV